MPTYVRLLGAPEVARAGSIVPMRPERRYQLLAWLALRAGPVSRDRLAAMFWPERDNATARRNLRKLAFDAQDFDWAGELSGDRATLAWPVQTDVADFDRALADGHVDEALRLYRGPLCENLEDPHNNAFAEALAFERARLAERWRALVLGRLERAETEPGPALELAQRLLDNDPCDEDAAAAIMRACRALGREADALRAYRAFKARVADALGIEPSARLRSLARTIEAGPAERAPPEVAAAQPHSFVGRAGELRELRALLESDECRLVTITGPGGTGKSRLAKAALPALDAGFAGGVWWIPLDDLDDVDLVGVRLAQVLGIELAPARDALDAVAALLAPRRALLVLDNSEQIRALATLVESLLGRAPALKILATSRGRLGAAGEWLLPLAGLQVPPDETDGAARAFDAVRLFELRARAASTAFDPAREAAAIARLVRALGGLPLAIELAAQWVRLMPVDEITAQLALSLDVLERAEDGDERPEHRSVRATFEHSWRLLAPSEQQALAMLSTMVGTFSLAAAREVAQAPLPVIAALTDKSLVQVEGHGRFSLHPLIQQFSRERCRALALTPLAEARHGAWFTRLLARQRAARADAQRAALVELERDFENCRVAWHWAIETRALEALAAGAIALMWFGEVRGRPNEAVALLEAAQAALDVQRPADRSALLNVQRAKGHLLFKLGRLEAAAAEGRRALKVARQLGDRDGIKACLNTIGLAVWQCGRHREARRYFEEALRRARSDNDTRGVAAFLANLGLVEKALGDFARARALYDEALERARGLGDMLAVAICCNNLGELHYAHREWQAARTHFEEGLAISDRQGLQSYRPFFLYGLAQVALQLEELDRADEASRRAVSEAREAALSQIEAQALLVRARVAARRKQAGVARDHVRTAGTIAIAMASEPIQLECLLVLIDLSIGAGQLRTAATLCAFVARHAATERAERLETEAKLAALVAQAGAPAEPPGLAVAALLGAMLEDAPGRRHPDDAAADAPHATTAHAARSLTPLAR